MSGTLYGLSVGPGDPELLTLKALRILQASPVVAYPAPDHGASFARSIVAAHLAPHQDEVPIVVPMRVERFPAASVYDQAASVIAAHLAAGRDVAVLCEGDALFYGSFMYIFERLADRFPAEIVPGVTSVSAAAARLKRPLAARNDVLTVLPAPLDDEALAARIGACEAFAIIKLGRHFDRVRALLERLGLTETSVLCERVTLEAERIVPLGEIAGEVPYFSMILGYRGAETAILRGPPAGLHAEPAR
jgi:precorrin-2/cobalt-factor-2 C20-methyltransferase